MSDDGFELVSLGDDSAEVCVDGYCEIPARRDLAIEASERSPQGDPE
jgi:hypothetical protein